MPIPDYVELYRAGRLQEAAAACERRLSERPDAADARLYLGLTMLRQAQARPAIKCLKVIDGAIDGHALLATLRTGLDGHDLDLQSAMALGGFLRTTFARLQPRCDQPVADRYINVLGSSHARSFGTHPIFFPLFIAIGRTCLVLTEPLFQATRRKFLENLARLDGSQDIIVMLGGDPRLHLENLAGTRPGGGPDLTDADRRLMRVAAARYGEILREIKQQVSGRLILYNVLPTFDLRVNELTRFMNDELKRVCAEIDVIFLDICDAILDPRSGLLRQDVAAVAFKGDFHLNDSALPIVLDRLRELGVLDDDADRACGFRWSYVFGYSVSPGEESRIWCEPDVSPSNALTSDKVACSLLANSALDYLSVNLLNRTDARVLMVNVKEGYLPLNAPAGLMARCVAVADNAEYARMARRIAHFSGRTDIEFTTFGTPDMERLREAAFDLVVVNLHPDTLAEDCRRAHEVLARVSAETMHVLSPQPDAIAKLGPAARRVDRILTIGNHHIPAKWRQFSVHFGPMSPAVASKAVA